MQDPFDPEGVFTSGAPGAAAAPSVFMPRTRVTKHGKIVELPTKPKGTLDKRTRKAVELVVTHGVDPKDAYELVNGKEASYCAISNLKQRASEYSLARPEMQRLADRVVKNTLKGKPVECTRTSVDKATGQPIEYIEKMYPSHTNMLAAASMVTDRTEPVVRQNINLNGNLADFLPFELERYK